MKTASNPQPIDRASIDRAIPGGDPLVVDCDACRMRDTDACADCVVGVLFTEGPLCLDPVEREALDVLAGEGLVPRLRLVAGSGTPDAAPGGD